MNRDFTQIDWNDQLADDCRQLVRLAVREDLDRGYDWTTLALVDEQQVATVAIVARQPGVIAGLKVAELVLDEMDIGAAWRALASDGAHVEANTTIAELSGHARHLLTAERTILNFIGRLSGIATLTSRFVQAIAGSRAKIYDTRKTTPGWRRIEKYAVRCGGGQNHRTGLFDAILIKDNHLAMSRAKHVSPAEAVRAARRLAEQLHGETRDGEPLMIEVEVDTLEQLQDVLAANPDIVLLDNMTPDTLREAVAIRDERNPNVELEASGGINLSTIAAVAATGVERISVGALTHSAVCLDVAMDWRK